MLSSAYRHLLSWVFPCPCVTCGQPLSASEKGLCVACENKLNLIPPPHHPCCGRHQIVEGMPCTHCNDAARAANRVMAAMLYEDGAKDLLCAFKFERRKDAAVPLIRKALDYLDKMGSKSDWDAVVAVPMPQTKKADRGFNQSEVFAKAVAKYLERPYLKNALLIHPRVRVQSTLDKDKRRQNVKGAFRTGSSRVSSKKLLLVDDILTTGSTSSECARILLQAGASQVDVLCLARGA